MVGTFYLCTYCKKIIKQPIIPVWLCNCGKPLYTHYKWEGKKREILIEDKNKSK